jgi:hypothetical protein
VSEFAQKQQQNQKLAQCASKEKKETTQHINKSNPSPQWMDTRHSHSHTHGH